MDHSNPEVFDIESFEDVDSTVVRIKTPSGAPTPMAVTVAGPEHPDRKRLAMARQRRMRAALSKTGKIPLGDPEEDAAEELEMLVAATLGWTGASLPFSKDAARKLYSDPRRQWLREQVATAMNERELFTMACGSN